MNINEFKIRQDLLHKELKKRTEIEEEAMNLIAQGKYDESQEVLQLLDDQYVKEIIE